MEVKATIGNRILLRVGSCLVLIALTLPSATRAAPLPCEQLGRPLRIHVARGLWWQKLRLHEAVGRIGGADLSSSVDVYGNPNGYHGCARAMGTFPRSPEALAEQDLIILAGSRVAALPAKTQTALVAWVKAGGGLLITGGPLSLDCDRYDRSPLADLLPVNLTPTQKLVPLTGNNVLHPLGGSGLETRDASDAPRVYWHHGNCTPRDGSRVMMRAGETPLLVMGGAGKGKVAVFSGTLCGDPPDGETPFWDWPAWPQVMSAVLTELAPTSARMSSPTAPHGKITAAIARLTEIGDSGLAGLFDEDLEDDGIGFGVAASGDTAKELVELAKLTHTSNFAAAVARATAGSYARLSMMQANAIFRSVARHLAPAVAAPLSADLLQSTSPGAAALGLRLAGLGHKQEAGAVMVTFVANGLDALSVTEDDSALVGEKLRVPDGKDEGLRLAAAQALADLADPKQRPSLSKAFAQWKRERSRVALLKAPQRDVEEMITASLAAMGDPQAAVWIVDCLIQNSLALESAVNLLEHPVRKLSPQIARERKLAGEAIARLAARNQRIRDVLRHLPASTWPGLATRASHWRGEFATEALLLALAAAEPAALDSTAETALATIGQQSPIPAIRNLCQSRLANYQ